MISNNRIQAIMVSEQTFASREIDLDKVASYVKAMKAGIWTLDDKPLVAVTKGRDLKA